MPTDSAAENLETVASESTASGMSSEDVQEEILDKPEKGSPSSDVSEVTTLQAMLKNAYAELERSNAKHSEVHRQHILTRQELEQRLLDLAAQNRANAELKKQFENAQQLLSAEQGRTDSLKAALEEERSLTQELRGEVHLLSSRICELLEDRTLLVAKTAVRGDEIPPPLDWEAPVLANPVADSPTGKPLADLSSFLGGAPVSSPSEPEHVESSPTSANSFSAWLTGGVDKKPAEGPTAGAALRSMWKQMTGTGPKSEAEFRQLLVSLSEVPPTRHALRGPVSTGVERLRQVVSTSGEQPGTPEAARGALWTEAVGNRLRISETQFGRVCRRRDRLRTAWSEVDTLYNDEAAAAVAAGTMMGRARSNTAKTLFSQSASDMVQGLEKEELYLIGAALEQIPLDVNRTLSSRDTATLNRNAPSSEEVRDLLEAFAVLKPEFGYTQGMNFLAAIMLIHLDAMRAFVCFTNVVILSPWLSACYTFNMPVVQRYFDVFEDLLTVYVPRVGRHFQQLGLTSDLILVEWWFALFSRSLPLPIVVRLWDLFFLEGDFLLYRASLAILQCFSEALVARPRDECLALLSSWPAQHLEPARLFDTMERMGFNEKKLSAAFDRVPPRPVP